MDGSFSPGPGRKNAKIGEKEEEENYATKRLWAGSPAVRQWQIRLLAVRGKVCSCSFTTLAWLPSHPRFGFMDGRMLTHNDGGIPIQTYLNAATPSS